ncbi:lipid II flippase MurJ [Aliarcobacter butzleri]|uniref:lipid II flippase MurJ n=1 Tax=Aliarcobacter butzleri TaxID=28197 RepID=UPI0021B3A55D|nr:lipid II flippase MurJ [Aliarcobacter butzleri]MCT7567834.1 lipid II flippase MurJ [Aliarcobacter butzleri]
MKMLNKFIITVLFLNSTIFGADTTTPETQFTKGVNERTSCQVECPPFKDGFFGRIANFEFESGATTCYIYSKQSPQTAIGKVVNINQHCAKTMLNPESVNEIKSNTSTVNSHLFTLKDKLNDLYTNAGTTKYINLPKYMVAGLLADEKIIDIPISITTNEVTLNSGYTNTPNLVSSDLVNPILISRTVDALSNSVTFIINFLSSSDKILLSLKVMLFLFVGALSILLALSEQTTKKISKLQNHEDIAQKVFLGVFSLIVFFFSVNKIETTTGQLSQTGYQQIIRPLMYLGINTADKLTETATSSVLRYKFAGVGVNLQEDFQALKDLEYKERIKNNYYKTLLNECKTYYNTDATSHYVSLLNSNTLFPPSEIIYTKGLAGEEKRAINFYTRGMMNGEAYLTQNEIPAVSYCYQMERAYYNSNAFLSNLSFKIENYNSAVSTQMENKINKIVDLTYKNISELGFVSIVNLGTTVMAFDTFSLLGKNENKQENYEYKLEEFRNQSGYDIQGFAKPEEVGGITGLINSATYEVLTNAPYYAFVPFADNILKYINRVFNPVKESISAWTSGAETILSIMPFTRAFPKVLTIGINAVFDSIIGMLTIFLLKSIIGALPLIAIIGAGFLVITFYFLSVEILYIVIPFASIFAFSTGNLDIIKNLIKHTFLLALKPILIVFSVIMALFAYDMLNSLNQVVVTGMFEPLFMLANDIQADSGSSPLFITGEIAPSHGAGAILLFLKSTLILATSFITVFVCFYLVFNGANIMLDILGIRDGGFDVGGVIGDKVESKHSIAKMNTVV